MDLTFSWRKDTIDDRFADDYVKTFERVVEKLASAELADDVELGRLLT